MTEKVIQIILLINYEVCMILLQYEAFQQNITLIIKIIDLFIMALCARVLYYLKDQKKQGYPLTILCLLRVSGQLTLNYFFKPQILSVIINLNLIHTIFQDQLISELSLTKLPYLYIIGNVLLEQQFSDYFINIGIGLTCISIIFQFRRKDLQQKPQINPQKLSKDFDICISALPQKEFDAYKQEDLNVSNCKSPVYGGFSPLKELSKSMDSVLMDEYAWIKGQQFIVLDDQDNIIIQTFNVADFSRNSFSNSMDNDSVGSILNLAIVQGNRDFQDLIASSRTINQSRFTLKELINKLIGDYELYKNNMFIINKVDAPWMNDWMIKIFLVGKNKKTFIFIQIEQKEVVLQPSFQAFSQFTTYITPSLNSIMTISVLAEQDNQINNYMLDKYFYPIKISSVIIYLQLANMRDFNLHHQKKLLLKISNIEISTIFQDLIILVQDSSKAKGIEIKLEYELNENIIETDAERLKQLMLPLIKFCIKQTKDDSIIISWKMFTQKNYQVIIHTPINVDEKDLRMIRLNLKKHILQFSEFSVCHMLAQYLSGSIKKGLEIAQIEPYGTAFKFTLQSFNVNNEEMRAIRLIGQTHYQETSLSQLLAQQDTSKQNEKTYTLFREESNKVSMDHSLHFSQSRISKQQSQKFSEYQSNYVSQISKVKADSVNIPNSKQKDSHSFDQISNIFYQDEETKQQKRINYQTTPSQSNYQLPHFPEANINNSLGNIVNENNSGVAPNNLLNDAREREQTFLSQPQLTEQLKQQPTLSNLYLDFGTDPFSPIQIPITVSAKMQGEIIKFSTTGRCCSRVLIADCEYQNIQILEMILSKFKVNSSRAFSTEDVIKLLETKKKCKCGNIGYVLYFINVELPKKGGLWLSRYIKDKMSQKGYIIGTTGLVEYYSKIEYYRNGIDQYISLPFDLAEVNKILQISQHS
ncbi:unnamed protein product [Paramecium sonneborni]|uniref:Response regulatory domain-containing protein n=1 Tax=Paramecium sonneborni TaxID=65129 RepID=A0A8S1NCI3_9CILI|nr:unnamed protein product [Paramecium sonneborni]